MLCDLFSFETTDEVIGFHTKRLISPERLIFQKCKQHVSFFQNVFQTLFNYYYLFHRHLKV